MTPTYCMTQLNDRGNDYPFKNPLKVMRTHDCNVVQTAMGLRLWSGEAIKQDSETLRDIGRDHSGGTGTLLTTRCFEAAGMVAGTDFVRFGRVDVAQVRNLLRDDWYVVLYVDYGVVNDAEGGIYSGAKTFRGAHAIGLAGWMRGTAGSIGRKRRLVWDYDATFDGRRKNYPFGRQKVPFSVLRNAAASYSAPLMYAQGIYLASGYAVKYQEEQA